MEEGKDIAWKPIMACIGTGIVGIAIGVFLLAPLVEKVKAKKLEASKEFKEFKDSKAAKEGAKKSS